MLFLSILYRLAETLLTPNSCQKIGRRAFAKLIVFVIARGFQSSFELN
ncbi:hypothetical protein CZ794_12030 [Psychrobacter sp. JB385]|nr:hypothetical protein CZ794_12030 [Psychrobacter sp. JB385]